MTHTAIIQDAANGQWLRFSEPARVIRADSVQEVLPALRSVEKAVEEERLWAIGFIAYEASPAFDPALRVRTPDAWPLLWFGAYREPERIEPPAPPKDASPRSLRWCAVTAHFPQWRLLCRWRQAGLPNFLFSFIETLCYL